MPVVLRLLDQVYGLRRRLNALRAAVEAQPEDVRRALRAQLETFFAADGRSL
jgi:chaperone modulatory protein CbpM